MWSFQSNFNIWRKSLSKRKLFGILNIRTWFERSGYPPGHMERSKRGTMCLKADQMLPGFGCEEGFGLHGPHREALTCGEARLSPQNTEQRVAGEPPHFPLVLCSRMLRDSLLQVFFSPRLWNCPKSRQFIKVPTTESGHKVITIVTNVQWQ